MSKFLIKYRKTQWFIDLRNSYFLFSRSVEKVTNLQRFMYQKWKFDNYENKFLASALTIEVEVHRDYKKGKPRLIAE